MFNTLHNVDDRRNAWVFTCDRWAAHGCYIMLPINPETLSLEFGLRAQTETTKRGKIVYIARNQRNDSILKSPELQFTIPSGSILPAFSDEFIQAASNQTRLAVQTRLSSSFTSDLPEPTVSKYTASKPSMKKDMRDRTQGTYMSAVAPRPGVNIPNLYDKHTPIGIQNLYAFLMLADEQRFYNDEPNKIHVHINSLLFPSLFLRCSFTEAGLSWSESSEDPGQFNLEFTLKVIGTSPKIGYGTLNTFLRNYAQSLNDVQSTPSLVRMRSRFDDRSQAQIEFEDVRTLRGRNLAPSRNVVDTSITTQRQPNDDGLA